MKDTATRLNNRSDYLVVLVGTYNRLEVLKRTLESISSGTSCSHEIVVIDAGSTDGTVEYLESLPHVTVVLQGALLGQARAYNEVWRRIEATYTCWLSDDTEVVPGSLDLAVELLESDPRIGMVGLKMKDVEGPWTDEPYMGAVSPYGILNCNNGVLRMDVLRSVGFFDERYHSYHIDPDLTAAVLSAGRVVVLTRDVAIHHHRVLTEDGVSDVHLGGKERLQYKEIYREKFAFLGGSPPLGARPRMFFWKVVDKLARMARVDGSMLGLDRRDRKNLAMMRFVSWTEPVANIGRPYCFRQRIPRRLLDVKDNPCRQALRSSTGGEV